MRHYKPAAYVAPYYNGYFMLGRTVTWCAKDDWNNTVAWGMTRKECEQEAREKGYTPIRRD